MKALSIQQPHASRIASGQKTIEVRSWRTHYRGPLLVCASARAKIDDLPAGVAICVVDVIDCRPFTPADAPSACVPFREGQWAWVLGDVRAIEPFSGHGQLGLFEVELAGSDRSHSFSACR